MTELLVLEIEMVLKYRALALAFQDHKECDWLFLLRKFRQDFLSSLIGKYGCPDWKYRIPSEPSINIESVRNFSLSELVQEIESIELKHHDRLSVLADEFYFPSYLKRLVYQTLLPQIDKNLSELHRTRKKLIS